MFILPVSVTFTFVFRTFSNHNYTKLGVFLERVYTALHHSDPRLIYMEDYSLKVTCGVISNKFYLCVII